MISYYHSRTFRCLERRRACCHDGRAAEGRIVLGEKASAETEELATAAGAAAAAGGAGIGLPLPSVGVSVDLPLQAGGRGQAGLRNCLQCGKPRAFNAADDRYAGACANCGQSEKGANIERADMISGRHPKATNDASTATGAYD